MTSPALAQSAAEALAAALPVPGVTVAGKSTAAAAYGAALAVSATITGHYEGGIAIALVDTEFIAKAAGTPDADPTEVLRPALEASASALGDTALSALHISEAAIFDGSEVFELVYDTTTFGWVALTVTAVGADTDTTQFAGRLGRIHDVEMALTVEIGRTRMSVREALSMEPGRVIELDRSAGAPVDVMLNGRRIALGEVVVVDQDYGVRITRILDVAESPR